ncbi:hypothetical protein M569_13417 [Genlisea aurea]|uniref:Uncharacterized protein n=1 Tax=Genlisea aurea TaxID=192259 RepID=S8C3K1_9LAMI|nr:hypothetical protein M569_13417 [Genlisea aurea]
MKRQESDAVKRIMAHNFALYSFFFAFLFLSLESQARLPQSFNKASAAADGDNSAAAAGDVSSVGVVNKEAQPSFVPENENPYGLYRRDSSSSSSAAAVDAAVESQKDFTLGNPHLPKNYNPVAYVTQPENFEPKGSYEGEVFQSSKTDDFAGGNRYYGGSSRENYFPAAGEFQPQGMSDTRAFQNGKYFYDVNAERFSSSHPYETLKAADPAFDRPYYGNRRNYGNEFSGAGEGYQFSQQNQGAWP